MDGVEEKIEIETGLGTRDGTAYIHYRVTRRRAHAPHHRELVADFELNGADAFAIHAGGLRTVPGKIADLGRTERIVEILGLMVGVGAEASIEEIVTALGPAFVVQGESREGFVQLLFDELAEEPNAGGRR